MASPTTEHGTPAASQHPTPGVMTGSQSVPAGQSRTVAPARVGQMGAAPAVAGRQTLDTPGAEPILLTDIEPVYLVRMYPQAFAEGGSGDPRGMAMEAGAAAHEAGLHLQAAQQEPVVTFDAEGNPVPPPPDAPQMVPNYAAPIPRRAVDPPLPEVPAAAPPMMPPTGARGHDRDTGRQHPQQEHKGNDHPAREA